MRKFQKVICSIFSIILFFNIGESFAQIDQTQINTDAVEAYVTAYAAKDYDTMENFLAEAAVFEDPANHFEGREAIIAGLKATLNGATETGVPAIEIMKMRSGNNYIVAAFIDFNLLMAPGGTPEKEYNFKINFMIMLKAENGKIIRHDDFVDSDAFRGQLMVQIAENQGEDK